MFFHDETDSRVWEDYYRENVPFSLHHVGTHDINSLATGDVNFDEVSVRFLHCKVTKSSIVYSLEWSLHSGEENGVSGGRSI